MPQALLLCTRERARSQERAPPRSLSGHLVGLHQPLVRLVDVRRLQRRALPALLRHLDGCGFKGGWGRGRGGRGAQPGEASSGRPAACRLSTVGLGPGASWRSSHSPSPVPARKRPPAASIPDSDGAQHAAPNRQGCHANHLFTPTCGDQVVDKRLDHRAERDQRLALVGHRAAQRARHERLRAAKRVAQRQRSTGELGGAAQLGGGWGLHRRTQTGGPRGEQVEQAWQRT